ncbi:MAG: hypothetical protein ACLFTA_01645 [Candidatus Nanohaloarchaea archaeon]
MRTRTVKFFLLIAALGLLAGAVSADWSFEPNDYNLDAVSNDSNAIYTTDLIEDSTGEALSPEDIANFTAGEGGDNNNTYVMYEYEKLNRSSGNITTFNQTLSYSDKFETWYAEFTPYNENLSQLTFKARGDSDVSGHTSSGGEVTENVDAEMQDSDVDLLTELESPIKADKEVKMDVRVMNSSSGNPIDVNETDVTVYFHNLSEQGEVFELNNYNNDPLQDGGQYHHNAEVRTPAPTNSSFIMRVEADSGSSKGSESIFVDTAPAIQGDIASISSPGCSNEDVPRDCDPDAEIDTEFDVTEAGAEGVNLTIYRKNITSGEWENVSREEMGEASANDGALQTFDTNATLPDLNTSEFEKKAKLNYHAWNQDRNFDQNHTVDLKTFVIEDRSNPTAFKSREHVITLFLGREFSRSSYDSSRFEELNVTLRGPENEFNESYSMEDFEYLDDDGTLTKSITIPGEEASGAYELGVSAEDLFGETKSITRGLKVRDVNSTFSADEELDLEYSSLGVFNETITLENLVNELNTLEVVNENENLSTSSYVDLEADEEKQVDLQVNVSDPVSFESPIEFVDSSAQYNETTTVSVQGPNCEIRDEDLCANRSSVDVSTGEETVQTEDIGLTNLGDEEMEASVKITGNASQAFSAEENITLDGHNNLELDFSPEFSGLYSGDLEIETEEYMTSLDLTGEADISDQGEASLQVSPSTIDMGSLPEGEPYEAELTVENTGDVSIEDITTASDLNIDVEEFSLSPGESKQLEFTIEEPASGSIVFAGNSSQDEASFTVDVSGEVIEDYSERTSELSSRMNDLRSQTDDSSLESDLTEVSGMIDSIETQWERGDYDEARSTFEEAQGILDSVERDMASDSTPDDQQQEEEEENGGPPIIPILGVVFVLMLVGAVVFYESYIPEEGDPLYGVMGE